MHGLRKRLQVEGYAEAVIDTMMHCRRSSTSKQYEPYILEWEKYCKSHNWNSVHTNVSNVLSFLQELFDKGRGHSTINAAKCALSTSVKLENGQTLGQDRDVHLFLLSVSNLRPPAVRYNDIWDTEQVVSWMRKQDHLEDVTSDWLSKRLAFLIMIISGQRPQILPSLRISRMTFVQDTVQFRLTAAEIKHGRFSTEGHSVVLEPFLEKDVCVVAHLKEYLKRTKNLRGTEDKLFIITTKPYTAVSLNTLSNWIKHILFAAGIDTKIYGAGSTRAASTSKAWVGGAPIDIIAKTAGWSNATTFSKFYKKPIQKNRSLAEFLT